VDGFDRYKHIIFEISLFGGYQVLLIDSLQISPVLLNVIPGCMCAFHATFNNNPTAKSQVHCKAVFDKSIHQYVGD
jgi:hypothetical protein